MHVTTALLEERAVHAQITYNSTGYGFLGGVIIFMVQIAWRLSKHCTLLSYGGPAYGLYSDRLYL